MNALSRDAILVKRERKRQKVEIPEWDGYVYVQSMTAKERGEFERSFTNKQGKSLTERWKKLREILAVHTVVDDAGTRLFSEADVEALGEQDAAVLERLAKIAQAMVGIGDADIEELAKN